MRRKFKQVGLHITYIYVSRYMGDYLGPREELEEWVWTKVEAWAHMVCILA